MKTDRLHRMHSAEHLLNGTMVQLFNCRRSFSAHINKKKSKCDYHFDRNITPQEIEEVEARVNLVVNQDLPVCEELLERSTAEREFDLGRLPDTVGDHIRVIRMGNYDAVPCIGDHVEHTAQIGQFKIISSSFEKEVLRIRFKITDPAP